MNLCCFYKSLYNGLSLISNEIKYNIIKRLCMLRFQNLIFMLKLNLVFKILFVHFYLFNPENKIVH